MENNLSWFYDVITVAVVLAFIYLGSKRGFVKSIVIFLSFAIAFVGSYLVSTKASPVIFDEFIQVPCEEFVAENFSTFNANSQIKNVLANIGIELEVTDEMVIEILNMSSTLEEGLINHLENSGVLITEDMKTIINNGLSTDGILQSLEGNINSELLNFISLANEISGNSIDKMLFDLYQYQQADMPYQLTQTIIRPVAVQIITVLLFMITFVILMALVRIFANTTSFINKIPFAGGLNRFLGSIFGIAQGIVTIYFIALGVKMLVYLSNNELLFFNDTTIETTRIFHYLYNFSLF